MTSPILPSPLHRAVIDCLTQYLHQANTSLNTDYPLPDVTYQQRGTIAGSAHLVLWQIRLNKILLIENQHAFIDEVIPHELAHLLVYRQFGKVPPHGQAWRWMMATVLQCEPRRTHSFSVDNVQKRPYLYQCRCQTHLLTSIRHHKVIHKKQVYFCKQCQSKLVYQGIST